MASAPWLIHDVVAGSKRSPNVQQKWVSKDPYFYADFKKLNLP
jgi:hypothetical protein